MKMKKLKIRGKTQNSNFVLPTQKNKIVEIIYHNEKKIDQIKRKKKHF